MSKFLLLLHEDPNGWRALSPDQMQKALEKYMVWTKKSFYLDGKRLAQDPGRAIRSASGKIKTSDGPYSETKEIMGGFYLIEAVNYDEAVALAMDHPHLEYGGTVEVRKLWEA